MSGFSFGTPSAKPAFSFGALSSPVAPLATSSVSVTKPAFSASPGFSFGSLSTPTALTTATTTSNTGFLSTPVAPASGFQFGAFASPISSTTAVAAPQSTSSVFPTASNISSNLSFFGTAKSSESKVQPAASSSLPQGGFSLGLIPSSANSSFGAKTVASSFPTLSSTAVSNPLPMSNFSKPFSLPTAISTSASTSSVASPFGFSLSTSSSAAPTSIAAPTSTISTPAASLSLGGIASTQSGLGSSVETVAPKPEPTLTFRQLEDMVNKWTYELDEQERNFSSELNRLNKADCILIENAEKISTLHSKVEACKTGQNRIEQELDFIESQQRELESLLEPLEQAATDLPPSQQHADVEREAIFQMCSNTDLELGQLLNDLRDMADQVNSINNDFSQPGSGDGGGENRDPLAKGGSTNVIGQVTRILNSHMHSLSWLNQNTQELIERMKFINSP